MSELTFNKNSKSKRNLTVALIVLVLISVWLFNIGYSKNNLGLLISAILFSLLGLYFLIKNLSNSPILTVNKNGIKSNVNGMGLIVWKFITGFEISDAINMRVIVVNIIHQDELLQNKNPISRTLMKSNQNRLGSPVVIPESEFNESLESIINKIEEYKNSL